MVVQVSFWRILFGIFTGAAALIVVALYRGDIEVEDRFNPWAPLRISDAPNALTPLKMNRLGADRALCLLVLASATMRFTPLPDRETGAGCGITNAVRVDATSAQVGPAFSLSCRAAVALAMWEQHSLQPAAMKYFGRPVRRIEHFGSYSCRNVYGREDARRSRHATADAFDVAGFVLGNGKRIRVVADWDADTAESRFLRAIHAGACRSFDTTLGPQYNAAHRDHFHLDMGSYGICR
ncbi:MAG: extensin family protein [Dokdonella sp.]